MGRELSRYASAPAVPDAAADEPAAATGVAEAPGAVAGPRGGFSSIRAIASLSRREEALHALELAAAYFRTEEPSSPLPLLLDRAKRLAGMDFMDILRDLAPDGLSQAQLVAGSTSE